MLLLALFLVFATTNGQQEGCVIDLTHLRPLNSSLQQPVVLSGDLEFLYPEGDSAEIVIPVYKSIVIACPGGQLLSDLATTPSTFTAICNQDSKLVVEDTVIDLEAVGCASERLESVRLTTRACANSTDTARIIEVGFNIGNNLKFVPLYELCFDTFFKFSLWSNSTITPATRFEQYGRALDFPDEDDVFYGLDIGVGDVYNFTRILQTMINLTDASESEFDQHRREFSQLYLRRQSYLYQSQYGAPFHLMNTYLQWGLPVGYNWGFMQGADSSYAEDRSVTIQSYTGTHGVISYPHAVTGELVNLYLYTDEFGNPAIPFPAVFWKIVYNPATKEATVLLSVNGNYPATLERYGNLCPDISGIITWVTWLYPQDPDYGLSYICSYNHAKEAIPTLPDIEVLDILL